MAHERKRHLEGIYSKLLGFSPIMGIFGHRQVGKSTFLSSVVSEYCTLDDSETLDEIQKNAKRFLGMLHKTPAAIDECQIEPKLFPALKEWVRTKKKPGQFVLSGSVRFTSRQAIRESLAGRIAILEMLPFSVKEVLEEPLSDVALRLLAHKIFSNDTLRHLNVPQKTSFYLKHFNSFLENGGLPGICFIRNQRLQKSALQDLHDLILVRDLRLVCDVKIPIDTIKSLLVYISKNPFVPYNVSEVRRLLGLAPQTQKKLLEALESVFLLRRIQIPTKNKDFFLFEDQFEERIYSQGKLEPARSLETAVYRNVRNQFLYSLDKSATFETFLTRDNARVPIVIRSDGNALGFIIIETETPSISQMRSAGSFLKSDGAAKVVYLSNQNITPKVINERSLICSIAGVL